MILHSSRLRHAAAAFSLAVSPHALLAQSSPPTDSAQPQSILPAPQPTDELAEHLRTLARNPHDLNALIGAGQFALSVGDATAALGFFGRANDEAPSDGRVKAGLGSALLLLERPDDALRLFGEAVALGIPQSKIAIDRGLAYDLRGDQASAQRDYRLAFRDGPNDELVRRYALSLGISGQKNEALALLDPLLRKQDQAAWRDRTFILAMSGDVRGANNITRAVMPQQADAMEPFLKRLASFSPAQRARAVTYGAMPEDARAPVTIPSSVIAPTRVAVATPPPPLPVASQPPVAPPTPAMTAPQATPNVETGSDAEPADNTAHKPHKRIRHPAVEDARADTTETSEPPAAAAPPPPAPIAPPAPAFPPAPVTPPPPIQMASSTPPAPFTPPPAPEIASPPPVPKPVPVVVTAKPRFAIASLLDDVKPDSVTPAAHVPTDAELRAARIAAKKKAEAKAKADAEAKAEKAAEDAKREAERKNPAREWVQVAGGNNRAGFARTWAKLKSGHAALFEGRNAYYTPLNRTYRILVGPFDDASDARAYVNQLTKAGLTGFTFSSETGQIVTRLGTKGEANGDTDESVAKPETVTEKHHRGKHHKANSADEGNDTSAKAEAPKPKHKHRNR